MSDHNEDQKNNVISFADRRPKSERQTSKRGVPAIIEKPSDKTKRLVFESFIVEGLVMINFDTNGAGVVVPPSLHEEPVQALNFSYAFYPDKKGDLHIDEIAVSASLSFGGKDFHCTIPWGAIFALQSKKTGELVLWPHDHPRTEEEGDDHG